MPKQTRGKYYNSTVAALKMGVRIGKGVNRLRQLRAGYKIGKKITDYMKVRKGVRNVAVQTASETRRDQRQDKRLEISQHNDTSEERIHLTLRHAGKRNYWKSKDKIKYDEAQSYLLDGNPGLQLVSTPKCFLGTKAFLSASTFRSTYDQMGAAIFDMNPNAKYTGSNYVGASAVSTNPKINVEKYHSSFEILNRTNANTTVWVYWFKCIKNTKRSPAELWQDSLAAQAEGQSAYVGASTISTTTTAPGYANVSMPGMFPNEGTIKRYWKCLRVNKFVLQGGDTHKLDCEVNVNQQYELQAMKEAYTNDGILYYRDTSVVPLILARGALCTVTAGSTTEVTYSTPSLGVLNVAKYTFSVPKEPPSAPITIAKYDLVTQSAYAQNIVADTDQAVTVAKV